MQLERLLRLLVCPGCGSGLEPSPAELRCRGCGLSFPVRAGVPDVLDERERGQIERARESWGGERVQTPGNEPWLRRLRGWMPPPAPFLNLVSGRNLARLRRRVEEHAEPTLLDLGSGGGAGAGLARLGRELYEERTVRMDVGAFANVDLVASGACLPFPGETFHAVLLKAVLEHVPAADRVVAEAFRVLRPGGLLYVEVPFLFEYHPNPGDFVRFTKAGLEQLLSSFEEVDVGTLIGPWAATSSLLAQASALLLSGGNRLVRKGLQPFLSWLCWPVSLPDLLVVRSPAAHFAAHHLYAFASKPGASA